MTILDSTVGESVGSIKIKLGMTVPPKREGNEYQATYCTIPDENGDTSIRLVLDGTVVTVFNQICIRFTETIDPIRENGKSIRVFASRALILQKYSIRKHRFYNVPGAKIPLDIDTYITPYFKYPNQPWKMLDSGRILRACSSDGAVPITQYEIGFSNQIIDAPSILTQMDDMCELTFMYRHGDGCP